MPFPSGSVGLTSNIGTSGQSDTFPTHVDYLGLGGHRTVATIVERDAITTARRSFGMLVTVNADPTPANNKTYQLCNVAMGGVNNALTPLATSNLNWKEFASGSSFNFTGGPKSLYSDPTTGQITDYQYTTTRLLDSFTGNTFDEKLRYACLNADNGTIIDCTRYEGQMEFLTETVVITKSVKLVFPAMSVYYVSDGGIRDHMFWIKADNVTIEGTGRSSKKDTVSSTYANTQFHMVFPNNVTQNGGYHISNENITPDTVTEAYNVITLKGFDCIGVEQNYDDSGPGNTIVPVPWPSTSPNFPLPGYGAGGICIVEGNPFVSGGGNAVNQVYIENIFVWKTRDHGILLLGAILAQIVNCRVSNAAGHGFYLGGTCVDNDPPFTLGGSTSTYFVNCYASSGKLAGFCAHSASYSQFQNCAAEFFGMGYFLRSAFNVSLFGCGAEQNDISVNIPVNMGITFKSYDGTSVVDKTLNDIGTDVRNRYKGSSLFIAGGRNLYIPNFFSTEPGNRADEALPGSIVTAHINIFQAARAVYIVNPRLTGTSPVVNPIRIELSGVDVPRDVNLFFNPADDRPSGDYFAEAPNVTLTKLPSTPMPTESNGIVLDEGVNTEIKNGATFYRPFIYTPDPVYGTETTDVKGILGIDNATYQILPLAPASISETIYMSLSYMSASSTVYISPFGISTGSPNSELLALCPPGQNKKILSFSINGTLAPVDPETIDVYLYTASGESLLKQFSDGDTFPANITLASPVSIDGPWAIKIVPTVYGGYIKSLALAVINY
jgi:hypothetical protein